MFDVKKKECRKKYAPGANHKYVTLLICHLSVCWNRETCLTLSLQITLWGLQESCPRTLLSRYPKPCLYSFHFLSKDTILPVRLWNTVQPPSASISQYTCGKVTLFLSVLFRYIPSSDQTYTDHTTAHPP